MTAFSNLQGHLPGLRWQSFCLRPEDPGEGHNFTTLVNSPTTHWLLHDDWHRSRHPNIGWFTPLRPGHPQLVLPYVENSPTLGRIHISSAITSLTDTSSGFQWHGPGRTNPNHSSRASLFRANEISYTLREHTTTGTAKEKVISSKCHVSFLIFLVNIQGCFDPFFHVFSHVFIPLFRNFWLQINLATVPLDHGERPFWRFALFAFSTNGNYPYEFTNTYSPDGGHHIGLIHSPHGSNDPTLDHSPHHLHQENYLPHDVTAWWTLDSWTYWRWTGNLENSGDLLGEPSTFTRSWCTPNYGQSMETLLRSPTNLVLLFYAVAFSCSTTSWTHKCTFWTTGLRHPGSYVHSSIMLGKIRTTSFTRLSYIALLATMALYTTDFTSRPYTWHYDIFYSVGTYYFYTWTSTPRTTWCCRYVRLQCLDSLLRSAPIQKDLLPFLNFVQLLPWDALSPSSILLWRDRSFGSILYILTPWLQLPLALIHIVPLRTSTLLEAPNLHHGTRDPVAFQVASIHLLIDPFWSLWITLRCRSWPILVNEIMIYTVFWPTAISKTQL